jgi:DNA-directed RNA polymerase subunit RPC12/RpoP
MASANEKWLSIPKEAREQLKRNVWCTNCGKAVKIVGYVIDQDRFGIILKGKCATCGHDVARVIENN